MKTHTSIRRRMLRVKSTLLKIVAALILLAYTLSSRDLGLNTLYKWTKQERLNYEKQGNSTFHGKDFQHLKHLTEHKNNSDDKQDNLPCMIRALDPWDESLKPYIWNPAPLTCTELHDLFYVQEGGFVRVNNSYAIQNDIVWTNWNCFLQNVSRLPGDQHIIFGTRTLLNFSIVVKSHWFRITCEESATQSTETKKSSNTHVDRTVYDMMHFNPYWNDLAKRPSEVADESEDKPSVIILAMDSLSRSNAMRNLPKSLKYLKEELRAYDFIGYRKVGLNSFPNAVPLLTGHPHTKFPQVESRFLDDLPFLWNSFSKLRLGTFFIEDSKDISMFNYLLRGFYNQPCDYYFRPFDLALHSFEPVVRDPLGKPTAHCYGKRNYFDLMKEYLKGYLKVYRTKRKFGILFSTHVSHDYFNMNQNVDEMFLELLQWMKREVNLDNTLLLFLSDHGFRMGGPALTHIGRAENNNPVLLVHVPLNLRENRSVDNVLRENTERLVSHYDIYQTMYDMIAYGGIPSSTQTEVKNKLVRRNIFSSIPADRTCSDAGVNLEFCTCNNKWNVFNDSKTAHILAPYLVNYINHKLSHNREKCALLSLHNISDVLVEYSTYDVINLHEHVQQVWTSAQNRSGRYTLVIFTQPGLACFEGLLDYSSESGAIKIIGEPIRLNIYGNQSHCVIDQRISSLCYCKDIVHYSK
ncbi:uncharacterized protein LOC127869427 [Dreissena polymorpha]|uniref:Uncharacterized protein n=1 Tax=Dreissena polymorpha TaxID=45954 RepID=A0A9D4MDJ0_DREPO|nr:uncharacterized protein LOC127869427 [Dreissena polymorpha]KAH3875587.1 hypothetical protein DPMN_038856 [Dreissena polymorpha]